MKSKRLSRKIESIKANRGDKESAYLFGLLNRDYWRGRKDGKRAPFAYQAALGGIEAEELRHKNEVRDSVTQLMAEAQTNLEHIHELKEANNKKMEMLREENNLLSEGTADYEYRASKRDVVIASGLILIEIAALALIAKSTFGQGMFSALVIAVLLSSLVAFGVKLFLERISQEKKDLIKWIILGSGLVFILISLWGFVILRKETFVLGLTGGQINFGQISLGNFLLMTGLTLGVPLVCGVMYENALERMKAAGSSCRVYTEHSRLDEEGNDLNVDISKLREFNANLDAIVEQGINFRNNKYVRGFHIGAARNPDAIEHMRLLNKSLAKAE